ncbi:MAG: GntR family transcriptional regulator, partial [Gemmatimonadaceae bacterium]
MTAATEREVRLGPEQSNSMGIQPAARREQLVPVTEQLRTRVLTGMHLGTLAPGLRLPSVRVLCKEFDADPRTVVEAYHVLKEEGLVEMRERSGIYVAPAPQWQPTEMPATWLANVLSGALRRHIPARAFVESLRCALS